MPTNIELKEMCVGGGVGGGGVYYLFLIKNYMNLFPSQDQTRPFSHTNSLEARSVHVSVCTFFSFAGCANHARSKLVPLGITRQKKCSH